MKEQCSYFLNDTVVQTQALDSKMCVSLIEIAELDAFVVQ